MVLTTHDLGNVGISYVRDRLTRVEPLLGRDLLRLPLEAGRVWTRLPVAISHSEALERLSYGGLRPSGRAAKWAEAFVVTYLAESPQRCALAHAPWDPSWPVTGTLETPYFLHDAQIYLLLLGGRRLSEDVVSAVKDEAHVAPYVAVLTSLPEGQAPPEPKAQVTADTIALLAERTEYLIIGAYDAETDVIWERPAAQRPTLRP